MGDGIIVGVAIPPPPVRLTVTKVSNGLTGTFSFSGSNGIANHSIATTAAGVPGTAGAQQTLTTAGTATTVTEAAPPAGWTLASIACTVNNGTTTVPATGTANLATRTFTLSAADTAFGNLIACTFTNNPPTTLTVTKVSNGGTGSFGFSGGNGIAAHSITTTAAGGAGTAGAQQTLTAAATATAITEAAPPAGWVLTNAACTVTPPGGTAAPAAGAFDAASRTVNLTAADTAAGNAIACTFTNSRLPTVTVTKVSNGGTGTFGFQGTNGVAAHNITTAAAGGAGTAGAQQTLTAAGAATAITEDAPPAGWLLTNAACTVTPPGGTAAPAAGTFDAASRTFNLTAADTVAGNAIACTFTNNRPATLTVTKVSNGGTGTFGFSGGNGIAAHSITTTAAGAPGTAGAQQTLTTAGTATAISEDAPPAGWALAAIACTVTPPGGTAAAATGTANVATRTFNLSAADTAVGNAIACTFTNDRLHTLTIVKQVMNDNGGTLAAADFDITVNGLALTFGAPVVAGSLSTYTSTAMEYVQNQFLLIEADLPGYTEGTWSCTGDGTLEISNDPHNGLYALPGDEDIVCTIRNDDRPATLTLQKTVANDNGGTALNTAWTLTAAGPTNLSGTHGAAAVTNAAVNPGTYTLAEANGPAGYAATGAYSCVVNSGAAVVGNSLTLAAGDNAVCTITNDDQPARLTLQKTVTNDNGGTAIATAWTLTATGPTNLSGTHGAAAVTNAVVNAGTYTLAEANGPAGYAAVGAYSCVVNGNAAVVGNNLTLAGGDNAVCTITNDDQPARLTLRKTVINNNGATAVNTAWTLTATGPSNISGAHGAAAVTNAVVNPGDYTLAESGGPAGYRATGPYSCVVDGGAAVVGNALTLAAGQNAVCTITNDDLTTVLTITKITEGGVGSFNFTRFWSGGNFPQTIQTTQPGVGVTGAPYSDNGFNNQGMLVTESGPPAGWFLRAATCTVTRPDGTTGTAGTRAGNRINLSTADTARGNQLNCTFTNARRPTVTVTKISNGGTGTFAFGGSNGIANHSIATTADGGAGTQGAVQNLTAADTATTLTETVPAGWLLTGAACTVTPAGGAAAPAAGAFDPATATFNLTAADTAAGNAIACTFTNQRQSSLQLAKAWAAGSIAGDQVTIGATTGGSNNTASFGATAPTAADSGTAVIVNVGDSITLPAETGANLANYTTTVACSGGHTLSGTDGQQSNTLTITSGTAAVCTYTNTPRTATLQLAKAWAAGSTAGHQISIGATTGGTNNTVAFNATAPNAADSGTAAVVTIGNTITLPAEAGTNAANYTTTLACTGGHTLSGSNGQQANTLTITSANAAVCTYTNTLRTTDLSITKTNTPAAGVSDQAGDTVVAGANTTYRVEVTNNAATDVTGAVVRDTPQAGLNCPAGNAVNCSGAACPGGAITVGDLANGVTLGLLAAGASATLEFSCTVQ